MGRIPERPRTARGLSALRDRYIRRAEYLCNNREFLDEVRFQREAWERLYPEYPFAHLNVDEQMLFPWVWKLLLPQDQYLKVSSFRDAAQEAEAIYIRGHKSPELKWWEREEGLKELAFPSDDFYRDFSTVDMARPFILRCFATDPRLLSDALAPLFPMPTIELTMDMTPYWEQHIIPEEWEYDHRDQLWYIPVYPGMTAKDLEAAIPAIVEQVNRRLYARTVGARIESMAEEGATQQAIADALGIGVKSVQQHLSAVKKMMNEAA
jgi:hypothetical protein